VVVRCTAFLRFHGAEVLHVPPDTAPSVLPEPVQQCWEVDSVAGGPPVVIPVWVHRRAVTVYPVVGIQGEGQERGGPVPPPEHLSHGAPVDRSTR
jgi:hypothetical protein